MNAATKAEYKDVKTGHSFINGLCDIESHACVDLYFRTHVRSGESEYICERLSYHPCYGKGWCPLRFTEDWYTPVIRRDRTGWRFY
jgi:hypothetical protein